MLLQNSLLMGGRLDSHDRFSDWRLDVDNMTYEQLLELGDRIGYVSTGLKEDEISRCLGKIKPSVFSNLPSQFQAHMDKKCIICQEEHEVDDEMGKLNCRHNFHMQMHLFICLRCWRYCLKKDSMLFVMLTGKQKKDLFILLAVRHACFINHLLLGFCIMFKLQNS